jgi:ribonuclease HI
VRRDVWEKLTRDFVKINFDADFVESSGDGAWGFIVRSNTGEFIAAGARKLGHLRSALQAKTEACVEQLKVQNVWVLIGLCLNLIAKFQR